MCFWLCGSAGVFLAVWECGCVLAVWECGCVLAAWEYECAKNRMFVNNVEKMYTEMLSGTSAILC